MAPITTETLSSLSRGKQIMLATACGVTVGNVYLCQPLLDQMAITMGVAEHYAGLVAVGAQVGYALGILFVLPLADIMASRRLVRLLLGLTTLFLLVAAFSPTLPLLVAASIALTATTVVPQILIPVVSGLVAQESGTWRTPYILAAVLTGLLLFIIPRLLPHYQDVAGRSSYLTLLRSLPPLLRHRPLCLSMMLGFLVFGAFSAFWATLAFHLASPAFGLGPAAAGLFGLYGAPGAILAPVMGRMSDRIGTFRVNLLSLVVVVCAFVLAGWPGAVSLIALIVVVNLLDFGLQSGQIANQARIFTLGDNIRARVNTLYMVATFGGGAAGSLMGTLAWRISGWSGVCTLALSMVVLAVILLFALRGAKISPSQTKGTM